MCTIAPVRTYRLIQQPTKIGREVVHWGEDGGGYTQFVHGRRGGGGGLYIFLQCSLGDVVRMKTRGVSQVEKGEHKRSYDMGCMLYFTRFPLRRFPLRE